MTQNRNTLNIDYSTQDRWCSSARTEIDDQKQASLYPEAMRVQKPERSFHKYPSTFKTKEPLGNKTEN